MHLCECNAIHLTVEALQLRPTASTQRSAQIHHVPQSCSFELSAFAASLYHERQSYGVNNQHCHSMVKWVMSVCAVGVPDAMPTLAHDIIKQTNCSALQPLQDSLYPAMNCQP